mmetsp:Transcript_161286/g.512546  ORF Transcript_161286/g.512546 Transcript_161286/m.512546 type:complete len:195 (-) Transcript_161286:77-661(-)
MGNVCCQNDHDSNAALTNSEIKTCGSEAPAPGLSSDLAMPRAVAVAATAAPPAAAKQARPFESPPPFAVEEEAAVVDKVDVTAEDVTAKIDAQPEESAIVEGGPQEKGLVLGFKTENANRILTITHRPLGLDFQRSSPISMKKVRPGSVGESLGVQVGWEIHTVNGEDVRNKSFEYTYRLLKEASAVLPSNEQE